jgi:hypothetical protein
MTIPNPEPSNTTTIEPKVKWAAIGQFALGVVGLALFNAFTSDDNQLLMAAVPDAVEIFVLPLVPTIGGLIAGYQARHQWRSGEITSGQ